MKASCGNIHLAVLPHALLAFLLLVQELALARHVAAIALGGHVLAEGARTVSRAMILPPIAAWIGIWKLVMVRTLRSPRPVLGVRWCRQSPIFLELRYAFSSMTMFRRIFTCDIRVSAPEFASRAAV